MISLIVSILYLAFLECVLSVDNAVALAALVHARLSSPEDRKQALRWGILGAYFLRVTVILCGIWLLAHVWIKAVAACYLLFLATKELFFSDKEKVEKDVKPKLSGFWKTVLLVELLDLVFSIDSIAVTLTMSQTFWALTGGAFLGILLMRFAAGSVIKLLDRFPILEKFGFVAIAVAGVRILMMVVL